MAAIERICERFGVPLPAAALQFVKAHPAVTSTVVGTARPARVSETVELARVPIPGAFWAALQAEDLIAAEGAVSADIIA